MRYFLFLLALPLLVFTSCAESADSSTDTAEHASEQANAERNDATDPMTATDFDTPAKPLNMQEVAANLKYPEAANAKGIEGRVVVRVLVDEKGAYVKHETVRSPDQLLTDAVDPFMKQLKFEPGTKDGAPVAMWMTVPFEFKRPKS